MRARRTTVLAFGLAAVLPLAACNSGGGSTSASGGTCTVKIGSIYSVTGAAAAFGTDGQQSIQMAVEDVNKKGFTVAGKKCTFALKSEDMASNPDNMPRLAQDLITGYGAHYILGGDMSPSVAPLMTAAERARNVFVLSPATAAENYVGKNEPFFKSSASDKAMVNEGYIPTVAKALPDIKRVAILMNNDDSGHTLAAQYKPALEAQGIQVTQTIFFDPATTDFAGVVNQVPRGSVDGLFIGYNGDARAAAIMDAALESGLTKNFITRGISALPGQQRKDKVNEYAWLVLGADPAYPADQRQKDFLARYQQRFNITDPAKVTWFPFVHYDYLFMLAKAMEKAGTVDDTTKVANALRGMTYHGVVDVSFDKDGHNTSPMGAGVLTPQGGKVINYGVSSGAGA